MSGDGSFLVHQNVTHCKTLWPTKDIFFSTVYIVVNATLSGLGTITNFLLLVGLYRSKLTSQSTMKVICSLACSDFCISAFVVPTFLVALFQRDKDCKIHLILVYFFFTFAVNTVVMQLVLSIDRLLQISWPMLYRAQKTKKHMQALIFCVWAISPITAICIFFTSPLTQVYVLLITGMTLYIISAISYARILFAVHVHRRKVWTTTTSEAHSEAIGKRFSSRNGKLESARNNTKRITFKLHVEIFEDSPTRNEDIMVTAVNIEQTLKPKDIHHDTDFRRAFSSKRSKNLGSFLSVPEEPKVKNEHVSYCEKVKRNDLQQEKPDTILEEAKSEYAVRNMNPGPAFGSRNKSDNERSANLKNKVFRKRNPPRLEPVNFKGKDANEAVSLSKEVKVTWTVAMVIITLLACYVPYLWSAFMWANEEYKNNRHSSQRLQSTYAWTLSVAFLHSSINPIIMLARNKILRFHVKDIFKRLIP